MIRFVHLERRFEKELKDLREKGQKEALIAKKAEALIAALTQNGSPDLKRVWKTTSRGEKRIEGCLKYDLGEGYRAICFRRGETLFMSYIGTHEESHNWLYHYSGRHNWVAKENGTTLTVQITEQSENLKDPLENEPLEKDDEDLLMEEIDEKILRKIFSGLVKSGKLPD